MKEEWRGKNNREKGSVFLSLSHSLTLCIPVSVSVSLSPFSMPTIHKYIIPSGLIPINR